MSDKTNNNIKRDLTVLSQIDGVEVLRDAHDFPGHRIRVADTVSVIQNYFTHFDATYDSNNNPTEVCYFVGTSPHVTEIVCSADVAGSLNNTYFLIYAANTNKLFHVWYNVDGTGTDPDPSPGISTPIEVNIESNDPAVIVSGATKITINNSFGFYFNAINRNAVLQIETVTYGEANNTVDGSTGFTFSNTSGSEKQVQKVRIEYSGNNNPIYEGQELIGYEYNIFTGKFEKNPEIDTNVNVEVDAKDGDNIAVSRHKNYRNILVENDILAAGLSTSAYTEILSYTATEQLVIKALKIKADTFGAFQLKINGVVKDYYQTSPTDRNAHFIFWEEEDLPNTQDLTIEFLPDRIRNVTTYNFFMRIEAYVEE